MRMSELVEAIAKSAGLSRIEADNALSSIIEHATDALTEGQTVNLPGFGKFETRTRSARNGRNPATGELIVIQEQNTVVFKAGKAFKEAVNQ